MQSFTGEQMEYNPAVTLISFKNLHSIFEVCFGILSLAPKFGIWSPQLNWEYRNNGWIWRLPMDC